MNKVEDKAMRPEGQAESSVQVFKFEAHDLDSVNIKELSFVSSAHAATAEEIVPVQTAEDKDATMGFFVIGGVINISMILAYFIWAFFQWKKIDKRHKEKNKQNI